MTAFLIVAAWAIYGLLGPIRILSDRNRHNALFVWLREDTPGQHQPSIRVQEVGEWRLHKIIGSTAGLILATLLPEHPASLFAVATGMIAADNLTRLIPHIDYAGHGAEILNAEAAGLMGYRTEEARRVARDYDAAVADALEWFDQMHWLSRIIYWLARI